MQWKCLYPPIILLLGLTASIPTEDATDGASLISRGPDDSVSEPEIPDSYIIWPQKCLDAGKAFVFYKKLTGIVDQKYV